MKQMYIFLSGIPLFNKEIVQIIYVPQSKYLCFEKDVLSFAIIKSKKSIFMDKTTQTQIIKLIHQEVIPAIGCTEPVAVALAAAKAAEVLGCKPEKTEVFLSANILKNAMGVGIPGTGMVGLPIAVALGTLIGKSAYGLEVLRDLTPEALAEGKQVIEDKRIHIALKDNVDKLYIEVICSAGDETSRVIICHEHTNVVYVEKNGVVLTDRRKEGVSVMLRAMKMN